MSVTADLKKGAPVERNWRDINDAKKAIRDAESEIKRLKLAIADLRRKLDSGGGTRSDAVWS